MPGPAEGQDPSVLEELLGLEQGFSKSITARHFRRYITQEDMFLDAERCYRRAWKCFERVGHEPMICKMASALARLHLDRIFVPVLFFKTPLATATRVKRRDIRELRREMSSSDPRRDLHSPDPMNIRRDNSASAGRPTKGSSLRRAIDLENTQQAATCALNIAFDLGIPLLLIESYINLAELHLLKNTHFEATPFWWEARDLFLHLFVDGGSVSLARKALPGMLGRLQRIVGRLVRFLAVCDRPLVNQNILLFDVAVLFQYDKDRTLRMFKQKTVGILPPAPPLSQPRQSSTRNSTSRRRVGKHKPSKVPLQSSSTASLLSQVWLMSKGIQGARACSNTNTNSNSHA